MSEFDIRWQQRLANYAKALEQLGNAVATSQARPLSDLEKQGLIQAFEFTHELAWNVMRDYFAYQGNPGIAGSRDAAREAFQKGLIEDGEGWMEMIRSRNLTSHTYQQKIADEICGHIVARYFPLFEQFQRRMRALRAQS
ncbi:MAG: nucleotidyltransferase substrate binding protein [Pseudomonadota bacterium]|jgi:nucleotidyltransferase substrate binding protein (TIGR01987 family)